MNPLRNKKIAFLLVCTATLLLSISVLIPSLYFIVTSAIIWVLCAYFYLKATYYSCIPPEFTNNKSIKASKGTSDANKLGGKNSISSVKAKENTDKKIGIEGKVFTETEGELLPYDQPVRFPPRELERMLTEDELEMLDKHYHGFYHPIGISIEGEIAVVPRANSRYATHYTTTQILADYMLEEENE